MKRKKIIKKLKKNIEKASVKVNLVKENSYFLGLIHAYDTAIKLLKQKNEKNTHIKTLE